MKVCFYGVRRICPEKNCHIEYGSNGKCPDDLKYKEEEIPDITPMGIESIVKKEIRIN